MKVRLHYVITRCRSGLVCLRMPPLSLDESSSCLEKDSGLVYGIAYLVEIR